MYLYNIILVETEVEKLASIFLFVLDTTYWHVSTEPVKYAQSFKMTFKDGKGHVVGIYGTLLRSSYAIYVRWSQLLWISSKRLLTTRFDTLEPSSRKLFLSLS